MESGLNGFGLNPNMDESQENRRDYSYYKKISNLNYDRWHTQSVQNATALGVIAFNTGTLRLMPLALPKRTKIDRIGCEVTAKGTSGSIGRLGIYDSNENIVPNNLIIDAGTVTTSAITVSSIAIDVTLEAGLYYLALTTNSASNVTFRALNVNAVPNIIGLPSSLGSAVGTHFNITFSYGILPGNILNSTYFRMTTNSPIVTLRFKNEN